MSDSSGNAGVPVYRRLRIVSPCKTPERWCVDTQACSFNGICSTTTASMASLSALFATSALPGQFGGDDVDDAAADYDYAYLYDYDDSSASGAMVEEAPDAGLVGGFDDADDVYADEDEATAAVFASVDAVVDEVLDTDAPIVRVEKRVVCACIRHPWRFCVVELYRSEVVRLCSRWPMYRVYLVFGDMRLCTSHCSRFWRDVAPV